MALEHFFPFTAAATMSSVPKTTLSPEQYIAQERVASFKSEYFRGETFAMAGATREHNLIVANIVREAGNSLKDRSCEVYPSDLRVLVNPSGLYTYPDVTIVCGEPQFEDDVLDTLLNPTVLFEVVSESTESYDRGSKSSRYRDLASLKEYVLIAQDRTSVESYVRQHDGGWLLKEARQLTENAAFDSLGISIPMSEIYRNIQFEDNQVH